MNKRLQELMLKMNYEEKATKELIEYLNMIEYEILISSKEKCYILDAQSGEMHSDDTLSIDEVVEFVLNFYNDWLECSGKPNLTEKDYMEQVKIYEVIKTLKK